VLCGHVPCLKKIGWQEYLLFIILHIEEIDKYKDDINVGNKPVQAFLGTNNQILKERHSR